MFEKFDRTTRTRQGGIPASHTHAQLSFAGEPKKAEFGLFWLKRKEELSMGMASGYTPLSGAVGPIKALKHGIGSLWFKILSKKYSKLASNGYFEIAP